MKLGRNTTDLGTINYDVEGSTSTDLYTGDLMKVFKTTWARGDEIYIVQDKPLPAQILCCIIESEVN